MQLTIERRFTILKKKPGAYHAFPTLVRQDNRLWMACRSGWVSGKQDHGVGGSVLLFSSDVSRPDKWTSHGTLFEPPVQSRGNELDAVLSAPGSGAFFLATRDYERHRRNDVYLSRGASPALTERTRLTDISDQHAICFGHICSTSRGELLMPGYWGFNDEPDGTPVLLVSADHGKSWRFRGKVASSSKVGTRLTEYSLGYLENESWTVLIRSETPPYSLYRAQSDDDGRSWSLPKKTELLGHAPMIIDAPSLGGHLVIFRDLSQNDPGVSVGMSRDRGVSWQSVGRLASYAGSVYDGGYGDLIALGGDRYLAVYYRCDEDASPWIEGCIVNIAASYRDRRV